MQLEYYLTFLHKGQYYGIHYFNDGERVTVVEVHPTFTKHSNDVKLAAQLAAEKHFNAKRSANYR